MTKLFLPLLVLLILLAGPAVGKNIAFKRSTVAADTIPLRCFPPETQVLMADGKTKAIKDITKGDEVLADDPSSSEKPAKFKVAAQLRNYTEHLVTVEAKDLSNHVAHFKATREHPFWVKNTGWKDAKDLKAGDSLVDKNGGDVRVVRVSVERTISLTYNLTIDRKHTFYVVDNGVSILVHNSEFDIVPYRPSNAPNFNHHGVPNVWLDENLPDSIYAGRSETSFPTIELSGANHQAATNVMSDFIEAQTGSPFGKVDWTNVSPQEIQDLSTRMLDAANVPESVQTDYFSQVTNWLYSNGCQ